MIANWNIRTKLVAGQLVLILIMIVVTTFAYRVGSEKYLLSQAKKQMREDVESIVQIADMGRQSERGIAQRLAKRGDLKVAGQTMDSIVVIANQAGRIIYTNAEASDTSRLERLLGGAKHPDYLVEKRLIESANGRWSGTVLLATKIGDLGELNRLLKRTQLVSLVIAGLFALAIGALLSRQIAGPIRRLSADMRKFSLKKEPPQLQIRSKDEIGELAQSFRVMAQQLHKADRTQVGFMQNASHELKTPLMSIQGNAEAIKDRVVEGKEADESLDVIIAECQRLKGLVDELIYVTKLEQAEDAYRFEEVSINDIIGDALAAVRGIARDKGIAIKLTGDLETVGIFDREKLTRALINVIGNAVRYARKQVELNVGRAGNQLELFCRDDGKGFDPGEETRVFERFYKGEQGGTGIGLSIVKAVVEAHGGKVTARQGNPGAVFLIELPVRRIKMDERKKL